jgi:hypothetical protein
VGRRTKSLDALLPILYLRGVSTGDFQEALAALLGKDAPNLSPAVISRLTAAWQVDYDAWHLIKHYPQNSTQKAPGAQRGVPAMCDYSLAHLASRPARVGDTLITTKFAHSLTGGFCAVGEPNVAVCLKPGTELAFEREIETLSGFWKRSRNLGAKVARFRRVNEGCPTMHHDALEIPGGQVVLLTGLSEGQRAIVLQLPASVRQQEAEDTLLQEVKRGELMNYPSG